MIRRRPKTPTSAPPAESIPTPAEVCDGHSSARAKFRVAWAALDPVTGEAAAYLLTLCGHCTTRHGPKLMARGGVFEKIA